MHSNLKNPSSSSSLSKSKKSPPFAIKKFTSPSQGSAESTPLTPLQGESIDEQPNSVKTKTSETFSPAAKVVHRSVSGSTMVISFESPKTEEKSIPNLSTTSNVEMIIQSLSETGISSAYVPPHLRNREPVAPKSTKMQTQTQIQAQTQAQQSTSYVNPYSGENCTVASESRWDTFEPTASSSRKLRNRNGSRKSFSSSTQFSRYDTRIRPRDLSFETKIFGERHMDTGINFSKYDGIPVDASGNNVPCPIEHFSVECGIHSELLENISLSGYSKPTPVQKFAIPIVIGKKDIMACAQTGSGKTAAFLLPIISELLTDGPSLNLVSTSRSRPSTAFPLALILSPTRELSVQIFEEALKFTYRSWVTPCVVYGGTEIRTQIHTLTRGADILVATPGRLVDMIERSRVNLSFVRYLVLDEADRMLDMGFEPDIRKIVVECQMPSKENRQTLLFSATFSKEIQTLAKDFLSDYIFLKIGRVGSTSENIIQTVVDVEQCDKRSYLLDILTSTQTHNHRTLIFVEKKRDADILENALVREGILATSIHGDRTQEEREAALRKFRSAERPVLVATSVASRGLDIPDVRTVIIYDFPNDLDEYVHKIGRTGRVGNVGTAISFFSHENAPLASGLAALLRESRQRVPEFLDRLSTNSLRTGTSHHTKRGPGRQSRNAASQPYHHNMQSSSSRSSFSSASSSTTQRLSPSSWDFSSTRTGGTGTQSPPPSSWEDGIGKESQPPAGDLQWF